MNFSGLFVCLVTLINCNNTMYYASASGTMADLKRLNGNVFKNYSKEFRPVENVTNTLAVKTVFFSIAILDVDEVFGTIILSAGLCMFWTDFQLSWEPAKYGNITDIMVNSSKIWKPSIFLMSSASDMEMFNLDQFDSRIYSNGDVTVCPGRKITSSCSVDMTNFPTDSQMCSVLVTAWGYQKTEIKLLSKESYFYMGYFHPNGEWNVKETSVEDYLTFNSGTSILAYNMVLSRKSAYFVISIIIPVYTLCFLNPFVFLLPAASGERISYTITMFLSLAVYMTLVGDNMPKVSEPMAGISYFLLVAMLFSGLLIILTIFTLRCDAVTDVSWFPRCLLTIMKKKKCRSRIQTTTNKVKYDINVKNEPNLDPALCIKNACTVIEVKENQVVSKETDLPEKIDVMNFINMALFCMTQTVVIATMFGFTFVYFR